MCLYPRLVPNRRYTENIKNGGVVPAVYDKRALSVPAKCGNCMECAKAKAREWMIRLSEHIKDDRNGIMVTLTFSTESLKEIAEDYRITKDSNTGEVTSTRIKELTGYTRDNAIVKRAVRLFTERWRKKYKVQPRHWLVSELGTTNYEHVHVHGIIWTQKIEEMVNGKLKDITREEITRIWKYGWTFIGDYVNGRTVNYCVKYISKQDIKHKAYKPVILASKGLGAKFIETKLTTHSIKCIDRTIKKIRNKWYLVWYTKCIKSYHKKYVNVKEQKFNYENTKDYYRTETGHKVGMPQYWRKKIYSDEEREMLWMNKLDDNVRYINGTKVDLNLVDEEQYYKTLKEAQEVNKKLGYIDGTQKWKREQYEKERRNLMWEHRMRNVRSEDKRRNNDTTGSHEIGPR